MAEKKVKTVKKELERMVQMLSQSEAEPGTSTSTSSSAEMQESGSREVHKKRTITPRAEMQTLFPGIFGKRTLKKGKPGTCSGNPARNTCTLTFCCLAGRSQQVPSKEEMQELKVAGLGKKKHTFMNRDGGHDYVRLELEEVFPKLVKANGNYLFYKSGHGTNRQLTKIRMSQEGTGYTVTWLRDAAGSAIIYVLPMQTDLDMDVEGDMEGPLVECSTCGMLIVLDEMDVHVKKCEPETQDEKANDKSAPKRLKIKEIVLSDDDSSSDGLPDLESPRSGSDSLPDLERPRKRAKADLEAKLSLDNYLSALQEENQAQRQTTIPECVRKNLQECPLCCGMFPEGVIEVHADRCFERTETERRPTCTSDILPEASPTPDPAAHNVSTPAGAHIQADSLDKTPGNSWRDVLEEKLNKNKAEKDVWEISIIREDLANTLLVELLDGSEKNWHSRIKVEFLGEDGCDFGGLLREMFTIFFRTTPLLEGQVFKRSAEALQTGAYRVLGKAVAAALVAGHPGPQRLSRLLTGYIFNLHVPTLRAEDLPIDLAVGNAIEKIESAPLEEARSDDVLDLLTQAGITKLLTEETRGCIVKSLREYFGFYQYMGPIQHFMEGLELHGILEHMRQHPEEASIALSPQPDLSAQALRSFFVASYSEDGSVDKPTETRLMFNFKRFLTRVETGQVSATKVDVKSDSESKLTLTTGIVCQAFTGSEALPLNIQSGLVTFDHTSEKMPVINTCAPSITLTRTKRLSAYAYFEEKMVDTIICSMDFFGVP